jgi:comEA protein
MAKIEKAVIIILIILAGCAIAASYYLKISRQDIEFVDDRAQEDASDTILSKRIISINSADKDTLAKLTGIGPHLAQKIIDYRREFGSFNSKEDILKVKGMGPKKYQAIKDYIRVDE